MSSLVMSPILAPSAAQQQHDELFEVGHLGGLNIGSHVLGSTNLRNILIYELFRWWNHLHKRGCAAGRPVGLELFHHLLRDYMIFRFQAIFLRKFPI